MARLRLNNVAGSAAGNPVTMSSAGAGTATWTSAPAFATLVAPDYYVLIVEPGTVNEDIRYLTAYTSGATSGTITGPQEGSSGSTHGGVGVAWQHGPTVLDFGNGLAIFGDGSDGSPTFDGSTTILGMAPSSSVYTMTRDLFLASPTINSGVTIIANGYRLVASGTLTNNGTIRWNGSAGSGTTAGVAIGNASGTISASSTTGQAGGNGGSVSAGTPGTNQTASSFGGAGGAGGSATNGGGGGGTVTAIVAQRGSIRNAPTAALGIAFTGSATVPSLTTVEGGAGGGGGGAIGASSAGGGGGGGGGLVIVIARFITGTGSIQARGGAGANGGTAQAGGGGGGGGGLVIVISASISAGAITGQTIDANGGAFGTGSGTGNVGVVGSNGTVILIPN